MVARRLERLEALATELKAQFEGTSVRVVALDVSNSEAIAALPASLPENVDVLVNNAGLALGVEKTFDCDVSNIEKMMDTNYLGTVRFVRAFVPGMIARNCGHVINVSSIAGFQAYPMGGGYCASKHAVHAFTHSLRMELISTPGVRVTLISPGLVETEFSVVRFNGDKDAAKVPYKGLEPLNGDDVAESVVFAASRAPHVQITEITLMPSQQASVYHIHRNAQ